MKFTFPTVFAIYFRNLGKNKILVTSNFGCSLVVKFHSLAYFSALLFT